MSCCNPWKLSLVVGLTITLVLPSIVSHKLLAQGDFDYLSTGIGIEARREKIPRDFTVKLVFASTRGELLADVKVDIADREGNRVFSVTSEGPWLFVNLPQGVYDVAATFRNCLVKKEGVKITAGFTTEVVMRWDLKRLTGCR